MSGECTIRSGWIERTSLHLVQTSSAATSNPGTTWTQAAGVTSSGYSVGSRFSTDGTHQVTDATGGYVKATCRITFTSNENEIAEFGIGVNAGTPLYPSISLAPATGEPGSCVVTWIGVLGANDDLNLMLRCSASSTADITITSCQWFVEEIPAPGVVPIPGALSYVDADYSTVCTPTTAVGNDITDLLTLSGSYDWAQPASGNRPVLSNSVFSGGRLSWDFTAASSEYLTSGLYAEVDGLTAFSLYMQIYVQVTTANRSLICFGNSAGASVDYHLVAQTSAPAWRSHVEGGSNNSGGTVTTGEKTLVYTFNGSTETLKINDVAVINAVSQGAAITPNTCAMAAWLNSTIAYTTDLNVRRSGFWKRELSAAEATLLYGKHGT